MKTIGIIAVTLGAIIILTLLAVVVFVEPPKAAKHSEPTEIMSPQTFRGPTSPPFVNGPKGPPSQ